MLTTSQLTSRLAAIFYCWKQVFPIVCWALTIPWTPEMHGKKTSIQGSQPDLQREVHIILSWHPLICLDVKYGNFLIESSCNQLLYTHSYIISLWTKLWCFPDLVVSTLRTYRPSLRSTWGFIVTWSDFYSNLFINDGCIHISFCLGNFNLYCKMKNQIDALIIWEKRKQTSSLIVNEAYNLVIDTYSTPTVELVPVSQRE